MLNLRSPFLNKNAQLWLKALTSGRYRKADGSLRDYDDGRHTYCALGVAMKVYEKNTGEKFTEKEWDEGTLPVRVMNWLGLKNKAGRFELKKPLEVNDTVFSHKVDIPDLNDDNGLSLKAIAGVILSNASSMFKRSKIQREIRKPLQAIETRKFNFNVSQEPEQVHQHEQWYRS